MYIFRELVDKKLMRLLIEKLFAALKIHKAVDRVQAVSVVQRLMGVEKHFPFYLKCTKSIKLSSIIWLNNAGNYQ